MGVIGFILRAALASAVVAWLGGLLFKQDQRAIYVQQATNFGIIAYLITYFVGASAIFVGQDDVLSAVLFYLYKPSEAAYMGTWLLSLIPVLVFVAARFTLGGLNSPTAVAPGREALEREPLLALAAAATLSLGFGLVYLVPLSPFLIVNAKQLVTGGGTRELYEVRAEIFTNLHVITAGVFYGTIPCLAAMLLLVEAKRKFVPTVFALTAWLIVLVANLGTYQTAPFLAACLIAISIRVQRGGAVKITRRETIIAAALFSIFMIYNSLKPGMDQAPLYVRALQVFVRMPSAGPYFYDLHGIGFSVPRGYSLSRALGRYMFAQGAGSLAIFVPQPAFMSTWFRSGVFMATGAQIVVVATSLLLSRIAKMVRSVGGSAAFVGFTYASFHLLYYSFQTDFAELWVSSYSVLFPLLPPVLLVVIAAAFHQPERARAERRVAWRTSV